jgi:hypothetical protein
MNEPPNIKQARLKAEELIEHEAVSPDGSRLVSDHAAMLSIAISLKRIASALESIDPEDFKP